MPAQTPLHMPLAQHTLPFFNCKSYLEHPQWDYKRVKGLGDVPYYDIVIKSPDENVLIKAELDDKFLTEVEKKYRSKVKRREE